MKKIKEDVFMKRHNSKCAASIKALIDVAANDDVVTMTFRINAKRCGSLIHLILMVDFGFWDM